ncbi:haloacid dehalogenase, type II [Mollisia scopiformis]|uniref:Haloacid dehalogenase, type II n=1 Tax=Mollisia scopiformis TaxID=149040 RepID=A0A194X928_MOLSC|nr:haloacid dehalogenase, type II [Mollisia scopiformis]KUJ16292.1 haloacid dehalogenase, type II [Mollisia scopiformis]
MAKTIDFEPKYITFDCYGTLTDFSGMTSLTREIYGDRLEGEELERFIALFSGYRFDECLGPYKPYREVLVNAVRRTCVRTGVEFAEGEAEKFYLAVPTWGPHPDVPEGLRRLAKKYKLVILSNASDDQIMQNVEKLGAPFHAVFTAQQTKAYKPLMHGFEYMFQKLGCEPNECLHVSASVKYDILTAEAMGIKHKVLVNRKGSSDTPRPGRDCYEVKDIGELASMLGL